MGARGLHLCLCIASIQRLLFRSKQSAGYGFPLCCLFLLVYKANAYDTELWTQLKCTNAYIRNIPTHTYETKRRSNTPHHIRHNCCRFQRKRKYLFLFIFSSAVVVVVFGCFLVLSCSHRQRWAIILWTRLRRVR